MVALIAPPPGLCGFAAPPGLGHLGAATKPFGAFAELDTGSIETPSCAKTLDLATRPLNPDLVSEHATLIRQNMHLALEVELLRQKFHLGNFGACHSPYPGLAQPAWALLAQMQARNASLPAFAPRPEVMCQGVPMPRARTASDLAEDRMPTPPLGRPRAMSEMLVSKQASATPHEDLEKKPCADATTVMLRNLPNNYSRDMLLGVLDSMGFHKSYDFVYLPMDFKTQSSLGYAFVNFVTSAEAERCREACQGFSEWTAQSQKVMSVSWSMPHQGFDAHVERYKNSPVMHEIVPDAYKPALFAKGLRIQFPPPTKKLRAPRMRQIECEQSR